MKLFSRCSRSSLAFAVFSLGLVTVSCSNRPDPDLPFDAEGNYVAEWDTGGEFTDFQEPEPPGFYEPEGDTKKKTASRSSSSRKKSSSSSSRRVTPSYKATYTVKKGDTLWRISRKYGTTVSKLKRANGISGTLIKPGQKLKIPR